MDTLRKLVAPEVQRLRLLRRAEVQALTGLSQSGLYELMAAGTFVRPVQVSARRVGWPEHEVMEWIATRPRTRGRVAAAPAAEASA